MISGMPEFEDIYWSREVEYWNLDDMGKATVEMSGISERQNVEVTGAAGSFTSDTDDIYRNTNNSSNLNDTNTVISDTNASGSRQLLYVHVYNYLIKNGHYATARQFLREADLPLSSGSEDDVTKADVNNSQEQDREKDREHPPDLIPTRLQLNSKETLLLEWWNCFCRLRDHVEQTPLDELRTDSLEVPRAFLPKGQKPDSTTNGDNPLGESKCV